MARRTSTPTPTATESEEERTPTPTASESEKEFYYAVKGCPWPEECKSEKTGTTPKAFKFWGWTHDDVKLNICEHACNSHLHPWAVSNKVAEDALALKIKAGEVIFGERSVDEEPGDSAPKSSAAKHEEARKAATTLRKAETLMTAEGLKANKRAAIGDSVPLNSSATSSSFSAPLLHLVGAPQQTPLYMAEFIVGSLCWFALVCFLALYHLLDLCVCVARRVHLHSLAAFLICIVLIGESHPMWN